MKNRKFIAFIIAIGAITLLSFFGKSGDGAIVTLTLGLFAANVVQKNEHFKQRGEIESE